jgi:hypothetical protein
VGLVRDRLGADEAGDALTVARGQGVADQHAEVVADDGEAIVAQRGHQGGHAVGEGGRVATGGGFVAGTHAAQVGGDDGEVLGEGGHDQPPAVPELGPAGQEQQRRPVAAADGVQGRSAGFDGVAGERVGEPAGQVRHVGDGEGHGRSSS